jgi:pimeloyl-ACP methyl ester carboxylesterase
VVKHKNGMQIEGVVGQIVAMNVNPLNPPPAHGVKSIILVDDDLRRIFFGMNQLAAPPAPSVGTAVVKIAVNQRVCRNGKQIYSVGSPIRIQPFDDHGRRTFTMTGPEGKPIDVVQGITQVTPTYTRLEALQLEDAQNYIWSTRIATSSIPRDQLSRILQKVAGKKDSEKRLAIVKLYLQANRIRDARAELEGVIKDFPELTELKRSVTELRQGAADLLMDEIKLRRNSGQPLLAHAMLEGFPTEGVAGELRLQRDDMLKEFAEMQQQGEKVLALLKEHQVALEAKTAAEIKLICDEIAAELNIHTLDRMADYLRLADDADMTAEQKLSLAISGWLLGSGAGLDNLSVSKSLVEVRRLVRIYLNSKALGERHEVLQQLKELEGSTPERISRLIANMKPPYDEGARLAAEAIDLRDAGTLLGPRPKGGAADPTGVPAAAVSRKRAGDDPNQPTERDPRCGQEADDSDAPQESAQDAAAPPQGIPGLFKLTCKGPAEQPQITYYVQLPPEYDPYRRYPVIVTLNGAATTPQQQIDWWAGGFNEQSQMRTGQATRHGYIVVSPVWQKEYQRKYEFSLREHACVLNPLRDVFRRFAVDTDRVFLTGHSMGGDAAWDVGLAHPDLWAGVMPIVATSDKYIRFYADNAALLPMYFVSGERDGNRLAENAVDWDSYLKRSSATLWDIMVIQYLGRGHEHYHDEIQNLFTWMNLHKRNFFPASFEAKSMRQWDNFFWYVEAGQFPATSIVHPVEWTGANPPRSKPASVEGKLLPKAVNGVNVDSTARKVTVWLSPEMVNFDERVTVNINNKDIRGSFAPKVEDLLEDVRTRADRQHPFWLKVQN